MNSKQKAKYSVPFQTQDNYDDEFNLEDDSNDCIARNIQIVNGEVTTLNEFKGQSLETDVPVGAFFVPGIGGSMNDFEERSVPDRSLSMTYLLRTCHQEKPYVLN